MKETEEVFVPETTAESVALAQVSFIGKAQFQQQGFGCFICHINASFNAMQIQISKSISQNGRHCFRHQTLVPESAIEFIARCRTMKISIEVMQTARTKHSVLTFQRDAPADRLAPSVASLELLKEATGLLYQSIGPM